MADIAWSDVVNMDASLSAVASGAQTALLAYVNSALDKSLFGGESGSLYKLLRIYLAAHLGTLALPVAGGGVAGPVTAEAEGGVSRSYAAPQWASNEALGSTSFGQAYLALLRTSPARCGMLLV